MVRSVVRRCTQWFVAVLLVAGVLVAVPATPALAVESLGACVPPGPATGSGRIAPSAAFVLPDRLQQTEGPLYEQADWVQLLGELQASRFSSVIVQFAARANDKTHEWEVFFPGGSGIYTPTAVDPSAAATSRVGTLERILFAAKQLGMKVTIGLGLDEHSWFTGETWRSETAMAAEAVRANKAIDAIWAAYKGAYSDVIDGWYLPYELEGYRLDKASLYKAAYVDAYLKPVSAHAKAVSGKTDISVSPLFTAHQDATTDAKWRGLWTDLWRYVFNTTDVSVVAPQDGRGSGKNTLVAVKEWIAATAAAASSSSDPSARVWGNAEVYRDQNSDVEVMPITMLAESLQAMRAGGATKMITFSAWTFDAIPGHNGGTSGDRVAFAAAYREWVVSGACSTGGTMTAPGLPLAVTGATVGENTAAGAIDTNVTVSWVPATSTSTNLGRKPVAYQIRRDGRLIGEVIHDPSASATSRMTFQDYQQQPGRTQVYTIRAYDGWGVLSPNSTQAVVTIPWTSAALEPNLSGRGFNVARNAPFTVTKTEDQPKVNQGALGKPSDDSVVVAGDSTGKYDDKISPLAPKYSFGVGPATDGLLGTDNTYDGRWQSLKPTGTSHNWVMKFKVPLGAGVRQVNTQWRHHPNDNVTLPDKVIVKALLTNNTTVTLGSTARTDVLVAGATTAGTYWYTVTAATELANVKEVWLEVTSQTPSQLFLGEVQVNDNTSTNRVLGQPYEFWPYNDVGYSDWATGLRAWTLTDGKIATNDSQNGAWAGRNMTTLGIPRLFVTVDLGAVTPIEEVAFSALHAPVEGVGVPESWRVRTAGNNGTWSTWSTTQTITPTTGRKVFTRDLPTSARFVQFELTHRNTAHWMFLDEVEVTTTSTTNVAVDRPITLASNTPSNLPPGAVRGCAQSTEACNRVAANVNGYLANLTSDEQFPPGWNNNENRWAITRLNDHVWGDTDLIGATYEVKLGAATKVREITSTWIDDYGASMTLPKQITAYYLNSQNVWVEFGAVAKRPGTPQEIPQEMFTWTYRHIVTTPVTATAIRIRVLNGTLKPWGESETITKAGVARITAHSPTP